MDIRTQGFHTHPEYIPGIEHNLDGHKNPVSFLNNYNNAANPYYACICAR